LYTESQSFTPDEALNGEAHRDKRAEIMHRFLETALNIDGLDGKSAAEVFSDETEKRSFISGITLEDFETILNGVNGILRGKPKAGWVADGENVRVDGGVDSPYVPPVMEDRQELLGEVLQAAQRLNAADASLEDIALLVSINLNALHLYADGNGRTARMVYVLLSQNYNENGKQSLAKALQADGRLDIDLSPGLIQREIEEAMMDDIGITDPKDRMGSLWLEKPGGKVEIYPGLPREIRNQLMIRVTKDKEFMFLALEQFLQGKEDRQSFIQEFPSRNNILIDKFLREVSVDEIVDFFQVYRDVKRNHIRKLIDAFENPEKPEYQFELSGKIMSIRDYYKSIIKVA
jgi:hypothetical protein